MTRTRLIAMIGLSALIVRTSLAQDLPQLAPQPRVILPGYKTVADAKRADPKLFTATATGPARPPGYLGITLIDQNGKPTVDAVEPGSPADRAGIREGDQITSIDGATFPSAVILSDALRARLAGDDVKLVITRGNKAIPLTATLIPTTSPLSGGRAILGITPATAPSGNGLKVDAVAANGPAEQAGIKPGDIIVRVDGRNIDGRVALDAVLAEKRPGDRVDVIIERNGNRIETRAFLVSDQATGGRPGLGQAAWDDRIPSAWSRPVYRLAIIGIEYPDVKHNPKIKDSDWEASMFSSGTYTDKSATGQKVYGSMNDFFQEVSYGKLKIEGKFVGWIEANKKRLEYMTGSGVSVNEKRALLTEILAKFTAKDKDALKNYDGVFFLYAGGSIPNVTRGSLYWPHRSSISFGGRFLPYFIVQEGGERMMNISVFCHEFGHMIGLPDLYARPEQPGSEGVWRWCLMSNQIGEGRPQHPSAWCKERLGWIKPVLLDPRDKQKLILAPIWNDPTQCYKVALRPDGSEYFLLENRVRKGWDDQLPGEGLLIWRVFAGNRRGTGGKGSEPGDMRPEQQQPVYVEESHGILGPEGPRSFPSSVPFPSAANRSFTPFTIPSSRSLLGGGMPVYITNIQRLPDGRIAFHIGYEYQ